MLAGDLGRRTGRSESYPSSSLGVPRQVLAHGAVILSFRGGEIFGTHPLLIDTTCAFAPLGLRLGAWRYGLGRQCCVMRY